MLTHVEPTNALRQHQHRSEWGGVHHLGNTLSSDPLLPDQQCELATHGGGDGQRVPQKVEHRFGRPRGIRLGHYGWPET